MKQSPHEQGALEELAKWNEFWQDAIGNLTKVTPFPPILVCDPDAQRSSLLVLVQEVCRIALNPHESSNYCQLAGQLHRSEGQAEALRAENSSLRKELETLKAIHEKEMAGISKRIDRFQLLLTEFHETQTALASVTAKEQRPPSPVRKVIRSKPHRAKSVGSPRGPDPSSLADPHLDRLISQYTKSPKTPVKPPFSLHEKSAATAFPSQRIRRRK
jgi:hypothetical protein